MKYTIYTDGSCRGNGQNENNGGWAFLILDENEEEFLRDSGGFLSTTNNRMELMAMANGLEKATTFCPDFSEFEVYTDSAYIHNCYEQKWYKNWLRNGWINSSKEPVKNRDLWERIIPYFDDENFSFYKVKAHSNNFYNNQIDKMAVKAAQKAEEVEK